MADYNKIVSGVAGFFQPGDWKQAMTIMDSNKAINPLHANGMMSGIPRSIANARHGNMGVVDAVKTAHQTKDGNWDYGAIAGSYMGVSAAHRVLSGGGVTRDESGNPNLIGIPFV